jgi:2',3'-cyclic-nucleotide 2'-phosphodiesterase (5'-nucleotidase family)
LLATIERLRNGRAPSLWIDVGDFAQGSPLATISGGGLSIAAFGSLRPDAAVAGNHEFDWGRRELVGAARQLSFPLLAANDPVELPASALLQAGECVVGIIGLTKIDEPRPGPFWLVDDWEAALGRAAAAVPPLASELRENGADVIAVGVHEGVKFRSMARRPFSFDTSDVEVLCAAWHEHVDVVFGAHTLGRFIGHIARVPFLQPWAFGAEVGVADVRVNGAVSVGALGAQAGPVWNGPGGEQLRGLELQAAGHLSASLRQWPTVDLSLGQAIASAVRDMTGVHSAYVFGWELCTQPPLDGTYAYLPAGPVSEADLARVVPYTGSVSPDAVYIAPVAPGDIRMLEAAFPPVLGAPAMASGAGAADSLAVSWHFTGVVDRWLGRSLDWTRQPIGLRDALRSAIAERGGRA